VGGWEAWRVVDEPLGRRVGDGLAGTQVVDGKVPFGTVVAPPLPGRMSVDPGPTARSSTGSDAAC
jgi:hypothetical protein